jgi:hypothetical protein
MKRVAVLAAMASLVTACGCGMKVYDARLNATLEVLKYRQKLDANLSPAPTDAPFKDFPLFIRPPKDLTPSKQFLMVSALPPGQYELAASFYSQDKGNLHVLGRRKEAKKAPAKGAPPPPPSAPRGAFDTDVIALLRSVYGEVPQLQTPQFQTETKQGNEYLPKKQYRRLIFTAANGNVVRVYFYKSEPYDVALIWDLPAAQDKSGASSNARDLTLASLSVGRPALRQLTGGGGGEEEGAGGGGNEGVTAF